MRHAHSEGALVVLLVDLEHVLGRRRCCVREERHQERHVVYGLDVFPYCGDPVRKPSLATSSTYIFTTRKSQNTGGAGGGGRTDPSGHACGLFGEACGDLVR